MIPFAYEPLGAAGQVQVAGDFSGRAPIPMAMENGRFGARVRLDPGEYRYRLSVDGEWLSDPAAAVEVPNPFGRTHSVLCV